LEVGGVEGAKRRKSFADKGATDKNGDQTEKKYKKKGGNT